MSVLKTSGYLPPTAAEREKLGFTRPPECNLPFFTGSEVCKAFDAPLPPP